MFSGVVLPSLRAFADEPEKASAPAGDAVLYRFKDLKRCHDLWSKQTPITQPPPYQEFEKAIALCRQATCVVTYMNNDFPCAVHSGYLVAIPERHQTDLSRGKRYVATCDHGRAGNQGRQMSVFLRNGETVRPRQELILRVQTNGSPVQDLKVLECDSGQFSNLPSLVIGEIAQTLPANAPAITYEPLDCRVPLTNGPRSGSLERYFKPGDSQRPETFILTHIASGMQQAASHEEYSENKGFTTGGQLFSGGSGSPVVVWMNGQFCLAGHQVSYSPEPPSDDFINGELRCNGFAVHINGVVEALKQSGRWRR